MYCYVVWGGFKVVWVVWCVFGCFHGPRQYNTVFSVTNKQSSRGGHSLVSSVPMRDQRIVEHTLNSVIDI